jgi:SSS family solute:Na+ symporter
MWREHLTEIVIFTVLFAVVSGMGFVGARWRRPGTLDNLDEWGARRPQLRLVGHLVPHRR